MLTANFNNEPLGQPIGTGGAELGQPVEVFACTPVVQNGGFPTPSLVIDDESTTTNCSVRFEFLNGIESTGDVSISFWLRFVSLDYYTVRIREQGFNMHSFLDLTFTSAGNVWFDDAISVGTHYHSEAYAANQLIHVEVAFYAELGIYSVWMDGARVVHRRAHGVTDQGIGAILFGHGYDADLNGRMRVDSINVDALAGTVTSVAEDDAPALSLPDAPRGAQPIQPGDFAALLAGATGSGATRHRGSARPPGAAAHERGVGLR